jgi:cytochrome subunit of sulfide dehydrogenase
MFLNRHRTTPQAQSRGPRPRTTVIGVAGLALAGALVATPAIAASLATSASSATGAGAGAPAVVAPASITSNSARLLASNCYQCHGTYGSGGFESLAGESATELYGELKEFSASTSSNNIMAAHAAGYSDAQLRAIAVYLSTVGR